MDSEYILKKAATFGKIQMDHYLYNDVGMLPHLSSSIHRMDRDMSIFSIYSDSFLKKEFEEYIGHDISYDDFTEAKVAIKTSSINSVFTWISKNIKQVMSDADVNSAVFAKLLDGESWVLVYIDIDVDKNPETILKESGYDIDPQYSWILYKNDYKNVDYGGTIEIMTEFFNAMKRWDSVKQFFLSSLNEDWQYGKVQDWLNHIDEKLTVNDLYAGTVLYKKRQPGKVLRVIDGEILFHNGHIQSLDIMPYKGTGVIQFVSIVLNSEKKKGYTVWIQVFGMKFSDEFTPETPLKMYDTKHNEIFYMSFIHPDSECAVRCNCKDMYHRFAVLAKDKKSWAGGKLKPYQRKTPPGSRKSINVHKIDAACKHIIAVFEALKSVKMVSNLDTYNREIKAAEELL